MARDARIRIDTVGAFRVTGPDGLDLTPPGNGPRAVLAVVALSPGRTATRRWLEGLLWEERSAEQASGSLRHALATIRRALGANAAAISADRVRVALDPERTVVDLADTPEAALATTRSTGRTLLEGIDIASEAFEDWLRLSRSELAERAGSAPAAAPRAPQPEPAPAEAPLLFAQVQSGGSLLEDFFADSLRAQLGATVADHLCVDVVLLDGAPASAILAPGARCAIRVAQTGDRITALARLEKVPSGRLVWSRRIVFGAGDSDGGLDVIAALAFEASEILAGAMDSANEIARANAMAAVALRHVFSFDPERLRKADHLLARAQQMAPHAPRPALRALALGYLAVERPADARDGMREEARRLLDEALENGPDNALALAFAGDVHDLLFSDPAAALALAEQALAVNPGTGYAYASLGALELRRGRAPEALIASRRALGQLANTSLQVFALMRFCVAAMSTGAFAEAERAAARAAALAPSSRPPLRHLYALRLKLGDIAGARAALVALHRIEPDFTLDRLRRDPDFPAATIRATGLFRQQDVEL